MAKSNNETNLYPPANPCKNLNKKKQIVASVGFLPLAIFEASPFCEKNRIAADGVRRRQQVSFELLKASKSAWCWPDGFSLSKKTLV